jgi:MoxR-like ATPase
MSDLKEQSKVQELYNLIGERGLYVSSNYDIFTKKPEEIALSQGAGYKVQLIESGTKAYSSPLLFATLTSLLNHGTMLVTGAPGIGKTTSLEYAGHFFTGTPLEEILASEIQGHPQQTEEKLVASYDLGKLVNQGIKKIIPNKFLQCPVKILDEGNRFPADVLSIIMRLVDTGKAVYGGKVLEAKHGPLFLTANYADEGTFQLTPPFLDRFDVATMVTSPQPWDLRKIRERGDEKLNGELNELLKIPENLKLDFEEIRKEIKSLDEQIEYEVPVVSAFADFLYGSLRFSESASNNLARATKGNAWRINQDNMPQGHFNDSAFNYTLNELSVRTSKAIPRYTKAFAWFIGKDKVDLNDLKTVLPYLLWHKIQPSSKALAENQIFENDRIAFAESLVEKIENEYSEVLGSDALKFYSAALNALRTGKMNDEELNEGQIIDLARKSITKLSEIDKPYALTFANHLASEFNSRCNGIKNE